MLAQLFPWIISPAASRSVGFSWLSTPGLACESRNPSQELLGSERFIGLGEAVKVIDIKNSQIKRLGMGLPRKKNNEQKA